MRLPILAILAAILSSLACTQVVITPTLSPTATAIPTATPRPQATASEFVGQTAVVRAALVNVRAEPGGEVIGQLVAGTDVRVIECQEDWCEVTTDDLSGFVFVGCLSIADGRGCEAK